LDRPGFGISDPKSNRTILDWADDVTEVVDFLKIEKFSVIGVSGGGAYAAACANSKQTTLRFVGIKCLSIS
jgi:pimeloyl-ACP methyl ester carboxylesterase